MGDIEKNKDDDRYDHWEISYKTYKKSIEQYTLDFVASQLISDPNENIDLFKNKLKKISNYYINKNNRVLSYWSSGINKQKNGFETNLALNSLHLLLNKHSKAGCGAYPLHGQSSSAGSSNGIGLYSSKLPANMFVKYKEHRLKTESIWNLPEGTLNSVSSNNKDNVLNNIMNNTTKFLWITNTNPYHSNSKYLNKIKEIQAINDLFVVTSDCYGSITASLSDLVLPTAEHLETSGAFENSERKIQHWNQSILPAGSAMSDLWQCIEFSKRFKIKHLWGNTKLSNGQGLKNVIIDSYKYGYDENTSIYKVLFSNKKAKSFKTNSKLNSEVNGDSRHIIGSDGVVFTGYNFF
jgi:nitrate reductase NapA